METIKSYNDLEESIKIAEKIFNNCIDVLKKIDSFFENEKKKNCPTESKGTSYVDADTIHGGKTELRYDIIADIVKEQRHFENMKFLQEEILKGLNETKLDIHNRLNNYEGLEYQVFNCRVIKNLTQEQTAEELGKSTRQIQRIEEKL